MKVKNFTMTILIAAMIAMTCSTFAMAQTTVVVTPPVNSQGWSTASTTAGGTVSFVVDPTAPGGGNGALRLTTDLTTTAKAQYLHQANTPLAGVTELNYWTRQI